MDAKLIAGAIVLASLIIVIGKRYELVSPSVDASIVYKIDKITGETTFNTGNTSRKVVPKEF